MEASRFRPIATVVLGLLAMGLVAACGSTPRAPSPSPGGGASTAIAPLTDPDLQVPADVRPPSAPRTARPADTRAPRTDTARTPEPAQPTGPRIRVTWEALAIERERLANPRFGRRPQAGLALQQKVVLVSQSHPEAEAAATGWTASQNRGVAIAVVPDRDLVLFVNSLHECGFFRLARPTSTIAHSFQDPNARGRITVESGGESYTLLSRRGQGLSPSTKAIPPMYSRTKQAVMILRNQTATMGVVSVEGARLEK